MLRNRANNAVLASSLRQERLDVAAVSPEFDHFVQQQYPGLVGFLRQRTGSRQDAEDAAQESFTKLLRYRDSEPAQAWPRLLYRIAINVVHDHFRLARTHCAGDHVELENDALASPRPTPEENTARDQQLALLGKAILELPPKCKRVYLLIRVQGMSHRQVAALCGISTKMVEKHLANALVVLKRKVGNSNAGTSEPI
jgi:RNA polymerase sigma-70 factor (ECF subfamily)